MRNIYILFIIVVLFNHPSSAQTLVDNDQSTVPTPVEPNITVERNQPVLLVKDEPATPLIIAIPGDGNPKIPAVASPVNVPATSSNGTFTITWKDVDALVYEVWASRNGRNNYIKINTTISTSHRVSGTASGKYIYRVTACNSVNRYYCSHAHSNEVIVTLPVVANTTFSPSGRMIHGATTVSLKTPTTGATIYYSTDGSFPSKVYKNPIVVDKTLTIKAKAAKFAYTNSYMTIATFTRNYAPVAYNDSVSISEDTNITVAVLNNDSDANRDTISPVVHTHPVHGNVALSGNGIRYTPIANWHGTDSFKYRAKDSHNQYSSAATVTVKVNPVNDLPRISGKPASSVNEKSTYSFTPNASDPDGNSVRFSITGKPSWASFSTTTGRLYGTPNYSQSGSYANIKIYVHDDKFSIQLPTFAISVKNVNRAPIISGTPGTSVKENKAYSFTPSGSDPDGNALSFSISGKPSWASFSTTTGRLYGTPNHNQSGSYTNIKISVSDTNKATQLPTFAITVNNVNIKPTINISAPAIGAIFTPSQSITASGTADDEDGTISQFEFRLDSGGWQIDTSSLYTHNFGLLAQGLHTLYFRAKDSSGEYSPTSARKIDVVQEATGRVTFIHTDLLGSPSSETDELGNAQ